MAATAAATIASISTPVRSKARIVAVTTITPFGGSVEKSTAAWWRAMGWERGIWSGRADLNRRPLAPKASVRDFRKKRLPIEVARIQAVTNVSPVYGI